MEYMDEVNKLIKEKEITGDKEEEIILKNGQPARSLYSDRTHTYIAPSGKCWLDWGENRRLLVRLLGCSRRWTGLLLTASDDQVCHEEQAEQTLSAKTVKDLTWLLFTSPSLRVSTWTSQRSFWTHTPNSQAWAQ